MADHARSTARREFLRFLVAQPHVAAPLGGGGVPAATHRSSTPAQSGADVDRAARPMR